jgi:hypothetical protein
MPREKEPCDVLDDEARRLFEENWALLAACLDMPRAGLLLEAVKATTEILAEVHAQILKEGGYTGSALEELLAGMPGPVQGGGPDLRVGSRGGVVPDRPEEGDFDGGGLRVPRSFIEGGKRLRFDYAVQAMLGERPGVGRARKEKPPVGVPKGATADSLLAAARAAAFSDDCSGALDAWKTACSAGKFKVKFKDALDAVGGMVFQGRVRDAWRAWIDLEEARAEKAWRSVVSWRGMLSRKAGAAKLADGKAESAGKAGKAVGSGAGVLESGASGAAGRADVEDGRAGVTGAAAGKDDKDLKAGGAGSVAGKGGKAGKAGGTGAAAGKDGKAGKAGSAGTVAGKDGKAGKAEGAGGRLSGSPGTAGRAVVKAPVVAEGRPETLYLALGESFGVLGGSDFRPGDLTGCFAAAAFRLPEPGEPFAGSGPPPVRSFEQVTMVGDDEGLFRKLVWELAVRHGYGGPERTVVLMDGSQSSQSASWLLFQGAARILDFRELEMLTVRCEQALFGEDSIFARMRGVKIVDFPGDWTRSIMNLIVKGDLDSAIGRVDTHRAPGCPEEVRELRLFMKDKRKFMDYPAYRRAGLYCGDGSLARPPLADLWNWFTDWSSQWGLESAQAVATVLDCHRSGLWESRVESPVRDLLGGPRG